MYTASDGNVQVYIEECENQAAYNFRRLEKQWRVETIPTELIARWIPERTLMSERVMYESFHPDRKARGKYYAITLRDFLYKSIFNFIYTYIHAKIPPTYSFQSSIKTRGRRRIVSRKKICIAGNLFHREEEKKIQSASLFSLSPVDMAATSCSFSLSLLAAKKSCAKVFQFIIVKNSSRYTLNRLSLYPSQSQSEYG